MNDHSRDDASDAARPDASSGDSAAWDESFFDFVDRIERGDFPIEIPFAIDLPMDRFQPPNVLAAGDAASLPRFPTLRGVVRLDQAKIRDLLLDAMAAAAQQGQSKLAGLTLLARVDWNAFLDTAAEHFAAALADDDASLRADDMLTSFILDVHELGVDALAEVVARTQALSRAAGERLRDVILEAIDEPPCRDELGFLAVAELVERLAES